MPNPVKVENIIQLVETQNICPECVCVPSSASSSVSGVGNLRFLNLTMINTEHIFSEPHLSTGAIPSIGELSFRNLRQSINHQGMLLWNRSSNYFQNWGQKDIDIKMSSKPDSDTSRVTICFHFSCLFSLQNRFQLWDDRCSFHEMSWHWSILMPNMIIIITRSFGTQASVKRWLLEVSYLCNWSLRAVRVSWGSMRKYGEVEGTSGADFGTIFIALRFVFIASPLPRMACSKHDIFCNAESAWKMKNVDDCIYLAFEQRDSHPAEDSYIYLLHKITHFYHRYCIAPYLWPMKTFDLHLKS